MGSRVAEQHRRRHRGARDARRRRRRWRSSRSDETLNGDQRDISGSSRGPSPRSSRSRATCASCSRSTTSPMTSSAWATTPHRSPSRRASWRPYAPLRDYVHLPEMGRLVAQQVRDVLAAVVDIDDERARAVAAARRRRRRPLPPHLRRDPRPHAGRPCQRRSRARASCSPRTTSSASATASRTSPRTSSSSPPGDVEDLNP